MNSSRFGSCTASRSPGSSPRCRRVAATRAARSAISPNVNSRRPPARHRSGRRRRRARAGTGRTGRRGACGIVAAGVIGASCAVESCSRGWRSCRDLHRHFLYDRQGTRPMTQVATRLRVEHLDDTLGIDTRRPRLSWWLPEGSRSQFAYRIRTDDWDSGRVEGSESVLVECGGPPMRSRQRIHCTVKVWTDAGESEWSEPVTWEMGLLDPDDWVADWIEPPEADDPGSSGHRPPWLLRRRFVVDEPIVHARLYATAHGLYELFLNGIRVGDAELTPGCTAYARNLQVQTYDVTDLLRPGANVIGAILSDGWFRGQMGAFRHFNQFGDRLALLAQLELTSHNGRKVVVASSPEWTCRYRFDAGCGPDAGRRDGLPSAIASVGRHAIMARTMPGRRFARSFMTRAACVRRPLRPCAGSKNSRCARCARLTRRGRCSISVRTSPAGFALPTSVPQELDSVSPTAKHWTQLAM